MIIKLKVKDLNIIEQAAKLIRDKFKIDLIVTQCSMEAQSAGEAVGIDGTVLCASREPELRIALTTTKDHGGWTEHIDLSYAIYGRDFCEVQSAGNEGTEQDGAGSEAWQGC